MNARRTTTALLTTLAIAGCGATASSVSTPPLAARTPTAAGNSRAAPSAIAVVRAFAAGYLRFLTGESPASALPDSTTTVRTEAQDGGVVPVTDRDGPLALIDVKPAPEQPGIWYFAGRDRRHTFHAGVTVAPHDGGWQVTQLSTPDFEQDLAPPSPPPPPPAPGTELPLAAAREFLAGYLPYDYGNGPVGAIRDASPSLIAFLRAHPPILPPTIHHLRTGRVLAIALIRHGRGWEALPSIGDQFGTYQIEITLAAGRDGRWLATNVSAGPANVSQEASQ